MIEIVMVFWPQVNSLLGVILLRCHFAPPSMLCPSLWMEPGWSNAKNIIPVTAHPCRILLLADGALVERARRSRRADRDAPNESSVAQMRAELWPETCSGRICIQNVKAASILFSELWMIIRVCITKVMLCFPIDLLWHKPHPSIVQIILSIIPAALQPGSNEG